ncbi:hypothetical protein DN402_04935 [Streptomyces sp. SW4]|nr:hypothetical protein DN402_04935 [Streptomyces sp. SW4]
MGRKRVHDEETARALLDAAERILSAEGLEALTVRRVADEVGTTTRAVYTSLGSKEALVAGLGVRGFALLAARVAALPTSGIPRRTWSPPAYRGSGPGHWPTPRSSRSPSLSGPPPHRRSASASNRPEERPWRPCSNESAGSRQPEAPGGERPRKPPGSSAASAKDSPRWTCAWRRRATGRTARRSGPTHWAH